MSRHDTRDTVLAGALASGATLDQAAQTAGVSLSTAKRRARTPEFRALVAEHREATVEAITSKLTTAAALAVDVLVAAMSDPTASPASRVRAASAVLTNLLPLREHVVLDARVTALETAVLEQRR